MVSEVQVKWPLVLGVVPPVWRVKESDSLMWSINRRCIWRCWDTWKFPVVKRWLSLFKTKWKGLLLGQRDPRDWCVKNVTVRTGYFTIVKSLWWKVTTKGTFPLDLWCCSGPLGSIDSQERAVTFWIAWWTARELWPLEIKCFLSFWEVDKIRIIRTDLTEYGGPDCRLCWFLQCRVTSSWRK